MVGATYEIYIKMCADLLPTPDKPHYTFNLRDISRVIQGVMQAQKVRCEVEAPYSSSYFSKIRSLYCTRACHPPFPTLPTPQV